MTAKQAARATEKNEPQAVDPQVYADFIGQIELRTIWLKNVRIANDHGPETPDGGAIDIEERTDWEPLSGGFRALHQYRVHVNAEDETLLTIEVTFGTDFSSREAMTDEIFDVFRRVNLPVNTWPYLREFVATTMGRLNWMPFTLPALKRGTGSASKRRATRRTGVRRSPKPASESE